MVRLDRKTNRSFVEPGSAILEAVPVVVMGELEPDDKLASTDGVGSRMRAQEGFFGPNWDSNPDAFVSEEAIVTTDGSGNGAGTIGTATAGRRYRVISTWWRGTADADGTVSIGPNNHRTAVVDPSPKPCQCVGGDGQAIAVTIALAAAASNYVVGATLRLEDVEVTT